MTEAARHEVTETERLKAAGGGISPTNLQLTTAIIILVGFTILSWVLLAHFSADDKTWSHLTYIYGSFQSLATAAAGVLLGRNVEAGKTAAAQTKAGAEKDRADAAETDARAAKKDAADLAGDVVKATTESGGSPLNDAVPAGNGPAPYGPELPRQSPVLSVTRDTLLKLQGKAELLQSRYENAL